MWKIFAPWNHDVWRSDCWSESLRKSQEQTLDTELGNVNLCSSFRLHLRPRWRRRRTSGRWVGFTSMAGLLIEKLGKHVQF